MVCPLRESPFIPLTKDIIDEGNKQKPPPHWDRVYDGILSMRQPGGIASEADVDTIGCACLYDETADQKVTFIEVLYYPSDSLTH